MVFFGGFIMEINYAKNQITLYGKVCKLDTLIKKLASLSGEQMYHFLIDRTTQLPRRMNCLAMISVLNNKIKFLHSNSLSKDSFVKLQYYASYSEQQLFNLFNKVCDDIDYELYRKNLMSLIVDNYQALNINDGELMYLKNLGKQSIERFADYFNFITGASLEEPNTFDGQDIDVLKQNLQYSASNQDILDLASKYGVPLPTRLKREEYLEFILDYLKRNGKYSEVVEKELLEMNITQMSTYAKRMAIPMQPNMSKQELITYLFYFLDQCEIPTTSAGEISFDSRYIPLEFRVDLSQIDSFNNSVAKKVIFYQGDNDDESQMKSIIDSENNPKPVLTEADLEDSREEKVEEKPYEESEELVSIMATKEEIVQPHEEPQEVAWKLLGKKEEAPKTIEEAKAEEDLLAEDIINETLAQIKEKEVEEEEVITVPVDVTKTEANPYYASSVIYGAYRGSKRKVLIGLFTSLGAIALVAAVVLMFLL